MTSTSARPPKIQIRAGLSGYVAELGASFIGAIVGFKVEEREDHAAYIEHWLTCLLYTSPSPRDQRGSRMPSSA